MQLLQSDLFSDKICQLCASDLEVFSNLRQDLVAKQKNLYKLAGIDEEYIAQLCDEANEESVAEYAQEITSDFDGAFEEVEQEDEPIMFVEEEIYDEQDISMDAETIIKIEKVNMNHDNNVDVANDESTSFGFFEEIVQSEAGSIQSEDRLSQEFDDKNIEM